MPHRLAPPLAATAILTTCCLLVGGCGTTRSSDTNRTATEQLLISDAIDRAVQTINLQTLAGQTVYLDDSHLGDVVDRNYLISTLRQHLLASGCALRPERDQADFIVEARAGAIGTDRSDLLFGVPSMNVPQIMPLQPVPAAIPEVPIAKRRDQRGIAKIAVFAYHRETGVPVWQSGISHEESSANDVWILGAGPFQRGTIYDGTAFAGKTLTSDDSENEVPLVKQPSAELAHEHTFTTPQQLAKRIEPPRDQDQGVVSAVQQASASVAVAGSGETPLGPPVSPPAVQPPTAAAAVTAPLGPSAPAQTTAAASPPLRVWPPPAETAAGSMPAMLSARRYGTQGSGSAGIAEAVEYPLNPAALPQPRFSSPQ